MLRAALGRTPAASCASHGAGCANQWRNVCFVAGSRSRNLARRRSTAAQHLALDSAAIARIIVQILARPLDTASPPLAQQSGHHVAPVLRNLCAGQRPKFDRCSRQTRTSGARISSRRQVVSAAHGGGRRPSSKFLF
ncbi:hypothetical protein F511_46738 [Dorcoceras hygrometricum]|uniref:Uncharacterized protein n=1 Tax=Dorcoceras hygrometricum TaxID=472368 RepID=A0A2Z6ZSP8_9LAMI|nr:hypothetical protein F511_46738 [Dorcoceras hygrometricum]